MRGLGILLILAAGGCTWSHDFHLRDLQTLTPGETTKKDLDAMFGARDYVLYTEYFSSECDRVLPWAPLSWISWPIFLDRHWTAYRLDVRLDGQGVLESAALEISEEASMSVLMFFGPTDYTVNLTEEDVEVLRGMVKRGVDVQVGITPVLCFGGVIGWFSVPLEDYLGSSD